MAKIHFITFANSKYYHAQRNLCAKALKEGLVDHIWAFDDQLLQRLPFYYKHRDILTQERGAGYCLWKPYFILEVYKVIPEEDVILYLDAADDFHDGQQIRTYLETTLQSQATIFVPGDRPQIQYTKKECFQAMLCDNPTYHQAIQLEAGIIAMRKCNQQYLLEQWLKFCTIKHIITDELTMTQYPEYIDNRYDQSILTNLVQSVNKEASQIIISNDLRKWITCNVN